MSPAMLSKKKVKFESYENVSEIIKCPNIKRGLDRYSLVCLIYFTIEYVR